MKSGPSATHIINYSGEYFHTIDFVYVWSIAGNGDQGQ